MPAEFERFWTFRPSSGKLEELSDGPGEQEFPVVFSNAGGTHAMGIYSPDQPSPVMRKLAMADSDSRRRKWSSGTACSGYGA
jgi:hypothetical protein